MNYLTQKFRLKGLMQRSLCKVKAFTNNRWFKATVIGFLLALISAKASAAIDPSSDILTNAKADIEANFGANSTFMTIVYIVEIVAGVAAYIKTKNLLALAGLAVVVIFTTVGFGIVG